MAADELKPCPFCGSPAELLHTKSWDYFVRCTDRGCAARTRQYHENDVATVDAWNTRAERTCRIRGGECDQCGAIIHERANMYWVLVEDGMRTVEHHDVHYCPNCGAKVVDE